MGRDRNRVAAGLERRRSRRVCTLERLEPRCVLNGSAPWTGPVVLPVSHGHGNIMVSGFVATPPDTVVSSTMKDDNSPDTVVDTTMKDDNSIGHSPGSPYLDGHNGRSLFPNDGMNVSKGGYQPFGLSISDPMERYFWTQFYIEILIQRNETIVVVDKPEVVPSSKPSTPDYPTSPARPALGGPSSSNDTSDSVGPRNSRQSDGESYGGQLPAVASVNAVAAETLPASSSSVAAAAPVNESRDGGRAVQVGRSSVIDSSAAGQINSAVVTATSTADFLGASSLGQTASMEKGDHQPAVNQALAGPRILSGAAARANRPQPAGQNLSAAEVARLLEGKGALAELPLDLRRMEQALESVVSEVKLIGPEVARWLDGVHAIPVTIAIAAAAVTGGSIYYWRRRGTRRVDRPEDEASSSWLFARLQPTPE